MGTRHAVLCFALIVFAVIPGVCLAEEHDTILVLGLTLPCEDCQLLGGGQCHLVSARGEAWGCEEFVFNALKAEPPVPGNTPRIAEMESFLLKQKPQSSLASLLLLRLLSSEQGRAVFLARKKQLLELYADVLASLVISSRLEEGFLEKLWQFGKTEKKFPSKLKAALFAMLPSLSFEDYFSALSFSPSVAFTEIKEAQQAVKAAKGKDKKDLILGLDDLAALYRTCLRKKTSGEGVRTCLLERAKELSTPLPQMILQKYGGSSKASSDPEAESLPGLIELFQESADREEQMLLAKEMVALAHQSTFPADRAKLLRPALLERLQLLLAKDKNALRELSRLVVKSAEEAAYRGEVENTIGLLRQSFMIYPGLLADRSALIADLKESATRSSSRDLLSVLSRLGQDKRTSAEKRRLFISFLILAMSALVVLWLAFALFMRKRSREFFAPLADLSDLTPTEREAEKRRLLVFFDLSGSPTEDQLTKRYHVLAASRHPDKPGGSKAAFSELHGCYQLAKKLFFGLDS